MKIVDLVLIINNHNWEKSEYVWVAILGFNLTIGTIFACFGSFKSRPSYLLAFFLYLFTDTVVKVAVRPRSLNSYFLWARIIIFIVLCYQAELIFRSKRIGIRNDIMQEICLGLGSAVGLLSGLS